jgi:hypothetical protein
MNMVTITAALPSILQAFANLYFLGGLALGMVLLRELYPYWRPGYARAVYDLLLMLVALFFVVGIAFYLSHIKPV